jgi:hypothetical protein
MTDLGVIVIEVTQEKEARVWALRAAQRERRRAAHGGVRILQHSPEGSRAARVRQNTEHLGGGSADTSVAVIEPLEHPRARVWQPELQRRIRHAQPHLWIRVRE